MHTHLIAMKFIAFTFMAQNLIPSVDLLWWHMACKDYAHLVGNLKLEWICELPWSQLTRKRDYLPVKEVKTPHKTF